MVLCTLLWSSAGLVMRATTVANGWEATFWRSSFLAVAIAAVMLARHGAGAPRRLAALGLPGLVSALAWATMFTCFMLALARTTVANTLFIMGALPFFSALAGWLVLGERVAPRTLAFMLVAAAGIGIMFQEALAEGNLAGSLIALAIPVAAAANSVAVKLGRGKVDFVPAILAGGAISALVAAPFAAPLGAAGRDLALFGLLAVFQLAIPGILLVQFVLPRLSVAEVGLLSLLEMIFGSLWVWLAYGEDPGAAVLAGGALVLGALVANEALALAAERRLMPAGGSAPGPAADSAGTPPGARSSGSARGPS